LPAFPACPVEAHICSPLDLGCPYGDARWDARSVPVHTTITMMHNQPRIPAQDIAERIANGTAVDALDDSSEI